MSWHCLSDNNLSYKEQCGCLHSLANMICSKNDGKCPNFCFIADFELNLFRKMDLNNSASTLSMKSFNKSSLSWRWKQSRWVLKHKTVPSVCHVIFKYIAVFFMVILSNELLWVLINFAYKLTFFFHHYYLSLIVIF